MPRTKLSEAAAQRKAKQTAKKTTKKTTKTTKKPAKKTETQKQESSLAPTTPTNTSTKLSQPLASTVPGLAETAPSDIQNMMPNFEGNSYQISDPLAPPESLPQVSESDFDSGIRIYAGATRALKLTGAAFDLTRERFTTESKRAKAFGSGVRFATDLERVRGDYLDYQTQLETTSQKQTTLGQAQHKTQHLADLRNETEAELDEKLEQAKITADLAREQTSDKRSKLDEFRTQLNGSKATKAA